MASFKQTSSKSTKSTHEQRRPLNCGRGKCASSSSSSLSTKMGRSNEINKVTILGAGGGIGQPLAMLLMLNTEYVQHIAMHDLVDSIHGVGLDVSHINRRCKITTHLGADELAEAVRGAKVVVIPAGLAQKPGMSRDDLFASNAKILFNLAKTCAQIVPDAMLAIITNPVNSLVPIACEVYHHYKRASGQQAEPKSSAGTSCVKSSATGGPNPQSLSQKSTRSDTTARLKFDDCSRRIFGVTTLDVVRASTLTAKSALFKSEPGGLFKDPLGVKVPVVGGHAGKTIMPLLSQATPKLDRKRLVEDKTTSMTLIESIQQAGIEVLNAKKGRGSATIAMAYAAHRFTLSLLKALAGEQNIVECAYVHQPAPVLNDLDYFATPLLLGKQGFARSLGIPGCSTTTGCSQQNENGSGQSGTGLLPFEQQMLEEGARELRTSIVRGEDFAREHLMSER